MRLLATLLSLLCISCVHDTSAAQWESNPTMSLTRAPLLADRIVLAVTGASSARQTPLLEQGQQSPQDPVESLRQHPDYIEQRARGVGLGAWGGPIRVDLEVDLRTRAPIRSVYLDRSILSTGSDPFSGRMEVALAPYLHASEQEARRAISQIPFSAPEFVFYTHYRGVEGIIFPTILSETTAPRLIRAVRTLLDSEASKAREASSVLLESILLAAGLRYPVPVNPGSTTVGRLVMDAGRGLSADELTIAIKLVSEGHTVRVLAESAKRTADFLVDGVSTELKTISNITSKDVSGALARRVLDGAGQAGHIIIDVRKQTGMTLDLAQQAIRRAYGADKARRIEKIRMIGREFDFVVPRTP